jgi:hypothetical protein
MKLTALGDGPVCITMCEVDGQPAVFASASKASIFFWDKNKLQNSPVMLQVGEDARLTALSSLIPFLILPGCYGCGANEYFLFFQEPGYGDFCRPHRWKTKSYREVPHSYSKTPYRGGTILDLS